MPWHCGSLLAVQPSSQPSFWLQRSPARKRDGVTVARGRAASVLEAEYVPHVDSYAQQPMFLDACTQTKLHLFHNTASMLAVRRRPWARQQQSACLQCMTA